MKVEKARKAVATSMLLIGLVLAVRVSPVLSAEVSYCPNSYGRISMDGHTVMRIWGVPGIDSGHAVSANPDYDWPTETSIVLWRDALLSAKRSGTCVTCTMMETVRRTVTAISFTICGRSLSRNSVLQFDNPVSER